MPNDMEGLLYKWTNYFSGWQPRWFVLRDGVLSYYKSEEDVKSGCKGSLKLSACDLIVHPTDHTRLDLLVPGEQYYYLKAGKSQERQQWLMALGSSKASVTYGKQRKTMQIHESIPGEAIRSKKSELRIYCDLLLQQAQKVKMTGHSLANPGCCEHCPFKDAQNSGEENNGEESGSSQRDPTVLLRDLNESVSLLDATCNTFITALEECMQLTHARVEVEEIQKGSSRKASVSSASSPTVRPGIPSYRVRRQNSSQSESPSPGSPPVTSPISNNHVNSDRRTNPSGSFTFSPPSSRAGSLPPTPVKEQEALPSQPPQRSHPAEGGDGEDEFQLAEDGLSDVGENIAKISTFMSTMNVGFEDVKLQTNSDGSIPVRPFLDACRSLVTIFGKLKPSAFAPVKLDFTGNIRKLEAKHESNPEALQTLQSLVAEEIERGQQHLANSATSALLWIKRGLEFVVELVLELLSPEAELQACVNNAYTRTLRPYHSWVVRGVFSMAAQSVPSKPEFLEILLLGEDYVQGSETAGALYAHLEAFRKSLGGLVKILREFYTSNDIDYTDQV